MKWNKLGLVYAPGKTKPWNQFYAILPTPIFLERKGVIRVFFSSTCNERFGRITYVDVDPNNPRRIISNPERIVLDVGTPGAFDDCGANPSAIVQTGGSYYMYYAGYQRHFRVPYSILSGLAVSGDLEAFRRFTTTPILERTPAELNLRSAPTVIFDNGKFRMWYVAGSGWETIPGEVHRNRLMPTYALKYGESSDGIAWRTFDEPVFELRDDEFGFGRPYAVKLGERYQLFYSIRRRSLSYRIGYAESADGMIWRRKDESIGIDVSVSGWDSEMICYPAVAAVGGRTYMFYNGNNNGETGFGVAELIEY